VISTSVLEQKGQTCAPTLIEAKVNVAAPRNYHTSLDGSRVTIVADPAAQQIEIRFETPKGAGSFWSTLMRQIPRNQRSRRPQPSPPVQ
jgi:hypothetical protein